MFRLKSFSCVTLRVAYVQIKCVLGKSGRTRWQINLIIGISFSWILVNRIQIIQLEAYDGLQCDQIWQHFAIWGQIFNGFGHFMG